MDLTQEYLRDRLDYDPETGIFTWKDHPDNPNGVKAGDIAGSLNKIDKYVHIRLRGRSYLAHRLAFLWMAGFFPEYGDIHINACREDNRWANLRHMSQMRDIHNRSSTTSGVPGVTWNKQRQMWEAEVLLNGEKIHLGYHLTLLDAALAHISFNLDCHEGHESVNSFALKFAKKHMPDHDFSLVEQNLYNHYFKEIN